MAKEYAFVFSGTREDFIGILNQYPNNNGKFFYFDDYIVELVDDQIRFGVERQGHSGGNWFIPATTEFDNRIAFSGKIQYIGFDGERSAIGKAIDKVGEFLLLMFLLPIILIFYVYAIVEWCVRKICRRTKPKQKTTEEKLCDLMENHLGCKKIEVSCES